ncbi:GNAT family N-acetyltransferase [Microvirga thermotolerans]|uniref:GNAT family N-acetyltransferase n=1 Tax=Microvirga thermotolerans TaxID=2651334 RepID=A0A5P9JZ81_9HYPH|nr:GNAT family N-acetyltransferase [Microvirga thermotolerans]QFU17753.1 GNAT family N-acetyltransferase [Microvirga thermotolerans]
MKVRDARQGDVPALAAIAAASYRAAFAAILEEEVLAGRDAAFFAHRFEETWQRMLVACAGEAPAGFLLMTDGHIDMLFMDPALGGKGGGARLLREAELRGAKSLECFRDNLPARRFYERHGWRVAREYERDFAGRSRSFVFYVKD